MDEEKIRIWDERLAIFHFGRLIERSWENKEIEDMDIEFREPNVYPEAIFHMKLKNGEEYRLEVEFEGFSSNFRRHDHEPSKCNLIICMLHDWKDSPVPVLDTYYGKIFRPHESIEGSLFDQLEKLKNKET